jgi:hypothetical protein
MAILALTSNTLIGTAAAGNLEYNGQFFGTDSAASRAQMQRITLSTAVASTSGTSIDFTSIPAWVKRITVMFQGVSLSGTATILFQIGSGSIATSGYASNAGYWTGNSGQAISSTSGYCINNTGMAAETITGIATFCLLNATSNLWLMTHTGNLGTVNYFIVGSGSKTLSGTLDQVRLTTTNGTDTFDAGSINILYEG